MTTPTAQLCIDTPTGPVTLTETNGAITAVDWATGPSHPSDLLKSAAAQLREYFDGDRTIFDLPLHVAGSAFQRAVCDAIAAIPFGETRTYGDLAKTLNAPAQAIGQGCGGNPIPIIIPCHRVLAANGLGGFSGTGGIETKVVLLRHEGAAGLLL